jgi:hypothetical protein
METTIARFAMMAKRAMKYSARFPRATPTRSPGRTRLFR